MIHVINRDESISAKEVERRIAEYRQQGFENQAMPHGVYRDPSCPWGCGFRIAAVDFQVEMMADPEFYKKALASWWQGPGIAGKCPGCGNFVLFGIDTKARATEVGDLPVLPDDWAQRAYVVS